MIYVMGDIHGNRRRFDSIMKQIDLQPEDTLYILGDVIDRYPDGISILLELMKMPNIRMLLGNHEYMMLNAMAPFNENDQYEFRFHEELLALWYDNGGECTHRALLQLSEETRQEIFSWLWDLPLNIDIEVGGKKYKLIHAAPLDRYYDYHYFYNNKTEFAVWHRWMPQDPDSMGFILILGHSPTRMFQPNNPLAIWHAPSKRRIGIDCGSGFPLAKDEHRRRPLYGRLACLRLDDMKEFYSEEPEDEEYAKNEKERRTNESATD